MTEKLAEIRRNMLDINKFLFGFIGKDYTYMDYVVSTLSRDEVPFYFSFEPRTAPYIYQAGRNQMNVIDEEGMVQRQGMNIGIDEEDYEPEELVKFISDYWPTYLELMTKEDPRKFKKDYQKLLEFCERFRNLSYPLFTEKTTFTFPRNLLNTLRAFNYSGYESCGSIAVSKLRKKSGKLTETEEAYQKYNYEVLFHSDKESACQTSLIVGGYRGEIMFHNHPFIILNERNYLFKFLQSKADLMNFLSIIIHCFSAPSRDDLNIARQFLFKNNNDIDLIICYHGIYLLRFDRLIRNIVQEINNPKFKKIYLDPKLTEKELDEYKSMPFLLGSDILASKFANSSEVERYHDLYFKYVHEKKPLSPEDEEFFDKYRNNLSQKVIKHMTVPQDINNINNYKSLLKGFYKPAIEYTQRLTKKVLEKVINYRNDTGNKIIAEFIPVEYNREKDTFEYPEFSVEVYPRLLKERRAMAPRRLTIQK